MANTPKDAGAQNTALLPNPSDQKAVAEKYSITVESPEAGGILAYLVAPGATIDFGDINLAQAAMREENGNLRITLADGSEILLLDYVGASQSTQPPVLMSSSGTLTAAQVFAQVLAADAFISATPAGGAEYCEPEEHEEVAVAPEPVVEKPAPAVVAARPEPVFEEIFDIEPAAGPEAPATISGNGFVPSAISAGAGLAAVGVISDIIDPFATNLGTDSIPEDLQVFDVPVAPEPVAPPQPVNNPPVAVNDTASIPCGRPVTINVLGNDSDVDGDTVTVTRIVNSPADLNVVINADGTVTATPIGEFLGDRTFTYEISDGNGGFDTATATITFTNDTPDAANDSATAVCGKAATLNVLANDTDPDGNSLTVTRIVNSPADLNVVINADGTVTATPIGEFLGDRTFTYEVSDGKGGTDTATATITFINNAPDAANDSATAVCGKAATLNVLANDTDPDGNSLTVTRIVSSPADLHVVINADGTVTATPIGEFLGDRTFTYEVSDGKGGTDTATATITFINNAPDAANDSATAVCGKAATLNVLANDTDPDGNSLTVTRIVNSPADLHVVINADGTVTATPVGIFTGERTFEYEVSDGKGGTDTATATITFTNDAPDAANDSATAVCGEAATLNVLANDTDPDGNPLTVTRIVSSPADLHVVINADGTVTATPVGEFLGDRTFTYEVSDGKGGTDTATATITFINNAPDARNDSATVACGDSVTIYPLTNDTDPDGNPLTITKIIGVDANNSARISADGKSIIFTGGAIGVDSITYEVSDGKGGTDTATIRVDVTNNAPDAANDSATAVCGEAATLNVLANDTDPDGNPLTVTRIVNSPADLNVVINADGTVTATPIGEFLGDRTFTYEVSDGKGGTDTATATITFINNAPDARNDAAWTNENTAVNLNVISNDSDPDGNSISVTRIINGGANGTTVINANGTITYTPNFGFDGNDTITYEISDGKGGFDTATVAIDIIDTIPSFPRNPFPFGRGDNFDAGEGFSDNGGGEGGGGGGGGDCPFVIDLDGDGIQIFNRANSNASFDLNGDGVAERTAWVGGRDAILAVDRNGDGMINGIDEVFGNSEQSGFEELAAREDSNGDGVVDANDAGFSNLLLWLDANGNGVSDEGELVSLSEYGIESINTGSTAVSQQYEDSYINEVGTVTLEDGSTLNSAAVWHTNDADDVVRGTDGNDSLFLTDSAERVVGGEGTDTVRVDIAGDVNFNADNAASIEVIDLTNGEENTVSLSAGDVLNFNEQSSITIMGDEGDAVNITDADLTQTGTTDLDGTSYATFSADNGAEVMIELGLTLNGEVVQ